MATAIQIDEPFTTWYCDNCGGAIVKSSPFTTAEQTGLVAWEQPIQRSEDPDVPSRTSLASAYRVLHKSKCDTDASYATWDADSLLGIEGLQRWSELLWNGPTVGSYLLDTNTDVTPTIELLYRFQVPYYEQARLYLHTQFAQRIIGGRAVLSGQDWLRVITEGAKEVDEGI